MGTHMKGVAKGSIKALRVVESPEKRIYLPQRSWFSDVAPAMNWHSFENKRILGTVPVEEDGSAYFEVPGNTYVYFQALDADGRMVQSMRSGATREYKFPDRARRLARRVLAHALERCHGERRGRESGEEPSRPFSHQLRHYSTPSATLY